MRLNPSPHRRHFTNRWQFFTPQLSEKNYVEQKEKPRKEREREKKINDVKNWRKKRELGGDSGKLAVIYYSGVD
jgi:hypothetical protein